MKGKPVILILKLVLNYDYLQFRSQVHREYMTGLSELMFT
jgi:hypothetical protein